MILQKIDNFIFRRYRWIIYFIAIVLIVYFEKFNLDLFKNTIVQVFVVTAIWICLIFLPRQYFMEKIITLNKFLWVKMPFLFKVRREVLNIPYFIEIILTGSYFFDRLLRQLFIIETRKKNIFLFLRLLIYYNLIIIIMMPFHLFIELYELILDIINSNIKIKDYMRVRFHYLILTILFVLLFSIARIDLIILVWILDRIIDVYYYWIKTFLRLKKDKWLNFSENCSAMTMSFMDIEVDFNPLANYLSYVEKKRLDTILLFKGTEMYWNFRFGFVLKMVEKITIFWNTKYIKYQVYKQWSFEYYNLDNDGQFLVRVIVKFSGARSAEDYKESIEDFNAKEWLDNEFSEVFNKDMYKLIFNFINNLLLSEKKEIINEFCELFDKYGNFYLFKTIMEENKEIKEFLLKLENLVKN